MRPHYEDPGQGSIAYWDMAAIHIQDPRAQSGRATVARPTQTQRLLRVSMRQRILKVKRLDREASELELELEVEALNPFCEMDI